MSRDDRVRARIESSFHDVVVVSRDTNAETGSVWDDATGTATPPAQNAVTVYDGPGVLSPVVADRTTTQGGTEMYVDEYQLSIPLDADRPEVGDAVVCTGVAEGKPEHLVGQAFRVTRTNDQTDALRQRVRCARSKAGPLR